MLAPKHLIWVGATLVLAAHAEQADHAGGEAEAPAAREAALPPCPGYDPDDDPYSSNARFAVGPNKGKCIDMRFRRPIVALEGEALARFQRVTGVQLQPGDRVVANVSDDEHNYYAVIPTDPVEDIKVQKELFDPGTKLGDAFNRRTGFSAHMQSRFDMRGDRKILLIPQSARERAKGVPRRTVKSLVASAEALTSPGDSFGIVKGMKNEFAIVTRFVTLDAKKADMIDRQKHTVQQFRVKPVVNTRRNPGDNETSVRQKYLRSAMEQSFGEAREFARDNPVMYDTLQNSCFTRGFRFYDQVNHYTLRTQEMAENLKRNPMALRSYLFMRGMMHLNPNPFTWDLDFADEIKQKGAALEL